MTTPSDHEGVEGHKGVERRCGARSKRTGEPCARAPVRGRTRCYLHGGATPRGMMSPHYRGRGYSKDIPSRLWDRYAQALADPTLLELTSEVSLVDTRMGELFAQLPEQPDETDPEVWSSLLSLIEQRRKLVETERKREVDLQLHLTVQQALLFVGALQAAVADIVTDPAQRQALARRFEQLMNRGHDEIVVEADVVD